MQDEGGYFMDTATKQHAKRHLEIKIRSWTKLHDLPYIWLTENQKVKNVNLFS